MRRRIGLNGLFLDYPNSGTWTYTRNLVPALANLDRDTQYRLTVRRGWPQGDLPQNVVPRRPLWPFHRQGSSTIWQERADKFGWEQIAWPVDSRDCDLMHSLYFAAPAVASCPLVVTVHDCIPLRGRHRHSGPAEMYAQLMRLSARRAAAIITVSNHAREEIAGRFAYPAERIFVTPEAPDAALRPIAESETLRDVQRRYDLPERYLLYLGGTEARKNLETLAQAWSLGPPSGVTLVIVGRFPTGVPLFPDIPALVDELGTRETVKFVPCVDGADLAAVYSGAVAFCYPSKYEGFGLPPLEAMACGVPVLASNSSSLPEVLGDAAFLIDPGDVDGWHDAMVRAAGDHRWGAELAARGAAHVRGYSWQRTARLTLGVYDRVLSS